MNQEPRASLEKAEYQNEVRYHQKKGRKVKMDWLSPLSLQNFFYENVNYDQLGFYVSMNFLRLHDEKRSICLVYNREMK